MKKNKWYGRKGLLYPVSITFLISALLIGCGSIGSYGSDGSLRKSSGMKGQISGLTYETDETNAPVVYFTSGISAESLVDIYKRLSWNPEGKVAVKISTGEPPASNYLRPELIKNLVQELRGTIVECNTAYGGSRSSSAMHHQVAKDHGFTEIADFDLLDEDGSMELPVENGKHLEADLVGTHFSEYGSYLVLSHFKGHAMAGFGGAIKNISIGLGSSSGKCRIHTGGKSDTNWMGGSQDDFLESMGEAGKAVSDYLDSGKRIVYINVLNRLSVDCDCDGNPSEPDMHDIGILASTDPVALDQASVDMVYAAPDSSSLVKRIESRNGIHTLEYAEEIGLGARKYQLMDIDSLPDSGQAAESSEPAESKEPAEDELVVSIEPKVSGQPETIQPSSGTEPAADENVSSSISADNKTETLAQTGYTIQVPEKYTKKAKKRGKIKKLTYRSKDYARKKASVKKTAYVYLPYGYKQKNRQKKYNVLYLMHGWGGKSGEYFENNSIRNMFDNMIADKDMPPMIIVSATFYNKNSDKSFDGSERELKSFHRDFVKHLMPAVEGKYHTYAKSTSKKALKASRDHRAFGGFSLGSVTTWHEFCYDADYIRYYLPMSGSCWYYGSYGDYHPKKTCNYFEKLIKKKKLNKRGYFIYATTGTEDIVKDQVEIQMKEMLKRNKVFTQKHVVYYQKKGGEHDFAAVQEYLYNALPHFFS